MPKYSVIVELVLFIFICSVSFCQERTEELRRKIGQMIMLGVDGQTMDDSLKYDLQRRDLGGVIFYAYNALSPAQIKGLSGAITSASEIPPFIAIDQEGGNVARLNSKNGFQNSYTAYQLGSIFNSEDSTRKTAGEMALWLKESGINMDLAPVVDLRVNPQSPGLASKDRLFSGNPDTVFLHSSWFIDECHKKGVLTSLKHFPGHGSASQDSHLGLPDISRTWSETELEPYKGLVKSGYKDAVMVGHLYNSRIDSVYPASLSYNAITKLLRAQLGFEGVVITDELTMGAIVLMYPQMDKVAELAINAGADILLYKINDIKGSSLLEYLIDAIVQKVQNGTISQQRIDQSYDRIIALKAKYLQYNAVADHSPASLPLDFALQNYPNPFNPETRIIARIPEAAEISIKIYNIQGQMIHEVFKGKAEKGSHSYRFNASGLSSGVYFVHMITPNNSVSSKIMYLK